ncbi:hypothetical protein P7K49_001176 [Saguinus oedipus]|uniref:Uncharacterized protein n=1 Tax=Saguinus oedipus TaxID=9490 RepID=A0ABQ9WEB9_SAGOE|nr:hypothetical protein P7K49_001176 [Saguinus oedipus]
MICQLIELFLPAGFDKRDRNMEKKDSEERTHSAQVVSWLPKCLCFKIPGTRSGGRVWGNEDRMLLTKSLSN